MLMKYLIVYIALQVLLIIFGRTTGQHALAVTLGIINKITLGTFAHRHYKKKKVEKSRILDSDTDSNNAQKE